MRLQKNKQPFREPEDKGPYVRDIILMLQPSFIHFIIAASNFQVVKQTARYGIRRLRTCSALARSGAIQSVTENL